jgi:hypothetical protein
MEYMLLTKANFWTEVENHMIEINKMTDQELVQSYNRKVEIGIVAVYAQAVYLVSFRYVFLERFKKSPIQINDGFILKLTEKIKLENQDIMYLDNTPIQ